MRLDQDCILGIFSSTPQPPPTKKSKLDFGSWQFTTRGHKHPSLVSNFYLDLKHLPNATMVVNTYPGLKCLPGLHCAHGLKHLLWYEIPTLVSNAYPGLEYLPGLYYICGFKHLPWFQTPTWSQISTLVSNTYLISNSYPGLSLNHGSKHQCG